MTPGSGLFPIRYAVAGMMAMVVAMGIGRFVYTPILPGMMDSLGLSAADAGLVASANYLGYLLGAIAAAGGWAHGMERRIVLAGLVANAVLAALMAATESLAVFLVLRFVAGWASAFVMIFVSTIVFSRLAAAGRSDLQALHFGGVGLGIAVSAFMTGALVLVNAPWWSGWVWAGILSLGGLVGVALLVRGGPVSDGTAGREPALPRSGGLTRLIIAYGLFGFGYIVTATFLIAIIRQGEAGRLYESAVWLATGLAGVPSVFLWRRVVARIGLTATFAAGCVIEALGVMASVSLGGFAGPLLGGVLLGGTFIALTAFGLQAAARRAPEAPRRALAVMTASFGVGQIVGPVFAGYAADATGSFLVPSLAAAAVLLLAGLIAGGTGRAAGAR